MKKIILLLIAFIFLVPVNQAQDINKLFKKYAKDERFEYVSVGTALMRFATIFVGGDKDYKNLLNKMNGVKVLTLNATSSNADIFTTFQNEIKKITSDKNFENVVTSRQKDEKTNIYRRFGKKNSADIVIVNNDKSNVNIVWFSGKLSKEEIDKFMKSITDEEENNE